MGLSTTEILVIVILIVVLFGAKKIPELARSLGRASYEFKKAKDGVLDEFEQEDAELKKEPQVKKTTSADDENK